MKLRMDKTLKFWVDVAYDEIKSDHDNLTKRQLVAQILRQYERRGDAMRCVRPVYQAQRRDQRVRVTIYQVLGGRLGSGRLVF